MIKLQTVSEITSEIKFIIENNFDAVQVVGEISNLKKHFSGHWYFTLKDSNAQISCAMWKSYNSRLFFTPENGMKVVVTGSVTLYPPSGNYQISVKSMMPDGEGELQAAFERLKRKLFEEGLFNENWKKPIPKFPKKIAIVTAEGAAALKDMLSVAARRFPLVEILHYPAKVQGDGAAEQIAEAINNINKVKEIDLIIVGRGGGSLEDLWAFNEEIVARAIYASEIPIISGVGHEIDFTIADFVADKRAETPTAAMEMALPDINEIFGIINEFSYNSKLKLLSLLEKKNKIVENYRSSYGFRKIIDTIHFKSQKTDNLISEIRNSVKERLSGIQFRIKISEKIISNSNIESTLKRGFLLAENNTGGIINLKDLKENAEFFIRTHSEKIKVEKWQRRK